MPPGTAGPGSMVAVAKRDRDALAVGVADEAGGVWVVEAGGDASPWLAPVAAAGPEFAVSYGTLALATLADGRLALLAAGVDGAVRVATSGAAGGAWSAPALLLPPGSVPPNASLATVGVGGRIDVLVVDGTGALVAVAVEGGAGSGGSGQAGGTPTAPPSPLSPTRLSTNGTAPPGAPVAAETVDGDTAWALVVGDDGSVLAARASAGLWAAAPTPLTPADFAPPRSHVGLAARGDGSGSLVAALAGADNAVWAVATAPGTASGWGDAEPVTWRGLLAAGSPLGVTRHGVRGQVDVVLTSATGTYAAWSTGGPWVGPAQVSIAE